MLCRSLAALASAAVLTLAPGRIGAQPFGDPRQPKIVLTPDLAATIDPATRIVIRSQQMRVDGTRTFVSRPVVDLAQCSGLQDGQRRTIQVPPLRWGAANINRPTGSGATPFAVMLSYRTDDRGLIADQVVTQQVEFLALGAQRFFTFVHPLRVAAFEVTRFKEPELERRPRTGGTGNSVVSPGAQPAASLNTYCVASVNAVDGAMVITADAAEANTDPNRANNTLRFP